MQLVEMEKTFKILSIEGQSAGLSIVTDNLISQNETNGDSIKPMMGSDGLGIELESNCESSSLSHQSINNRPPLVPPFNVPQELEDIIFDMAYPADSRARYISKKNWDQHEDEVLRLSIHNSPPGAQHYTKKPFPTPKVTEFMVSRGFFAAASKAWVRNQHFQGGGFFGGSILKSIPSPLFDPGLHRSIIFENCTDLEMDLDSPDCQLYRLPAIKLLSINLHSAAFESLEPKCAYNRALTEKELGTAIRFFNLDRLSGLKELSIRPAVCKFVPTSEQALVFRGNVQALEALVKPKALKPRVSNPLPAGTEHRGPESSDARPSPPPIDVLAWPENYFRRKQARRLQVDDTELRLYRSPHWFHTPQPQSSYVGEIPSSIHVTRPPRIFLRDFTTGPISWGPEAIRNESLLSPATTTQGLGLPDPGTVSRPSEREITKAFRQAMASDAHHRPDQTERNSSLEADYQGFAFYIQKVKDSRIADDEARLSGIIPASRLCMKPGGIRYSFL